MKLGGHGHTRPPCIQMNNLKCAMKLKSLLLGGKPGRRVRICGCGEMVDFVVSGPAEYVVINKLTNATPLVGLGRPDDHCVIIVRADSGINIPADLVGRSVAFGDIGSTSNLLCPMQVLAA